MAKSIQIFKSFEEQEQYHLELMLKTTAADRFRDLFSMQQITNLLHPSKNKERKIIIRKWTS